MYTNGKNKEDSHNLYYCYNELEIPTKNVITNILEVIFLFITSSQPYNHNPMPLITSAPPPDYTR